MSMYGPFGEDGGVLVGVVGTKEHAKAVSDALSSMYGECAFVERIKVVPPKKNASVEELLSGRADAGDLVAPDRQSAFRNDGPLAVHRYHHRPTNHNINRLRSIHFSTFDPISGGSRCFAPAP